jgi:hypothetical protein
MEGESDTVSPSKNKRHCEDEKGVTVSRPQPQAQRWEATAYLIEIYKTPSCIASKGGNVSKKQGFKHLTLFLPSLCFFINNKSTSDVK